MTEDPSNQKWGKSPSMESLPDIMYLNHARRLSEEIMRKQPAAWFTLKHKLPWWYWIIKPITMFKIRKYLKESSARVHKEINRRVEEQMNEAKNE